MVAAFMTVLDASGDRATQARRDPPPHRTRAMTKVIATSGPAPSNAPRGLKLAWSDDFVGCRPGGVTRS
jgi:hypothetical protein